MKKTTSILLTVCMILTLTSCGKDKPPTETPPPEQTQGITPNVPPAGNGQQGTNNTETPEQPFEGKIAIVTTPIDNTAYYSVWQMVEKYSEDKIVHRTWPNNYMVEQEMVAKTVERLGEDPDIKAIIVDWTIVGAGAAFRKLQETRKDLFIVYCVPDLYDGVDNITKTADLILDVDGYGMSSAMVRQAQSLGAKTFVHYVNSKDNYITHAKRSDLIEQECEKLGIKFVNVPVLSEITDIDKFILEDVPKMVEKYGKDTAFFGANCSMQPQLIKSVVEEGAIYPQPCHPSPFHGFAFALRLEGGNGDDPSIPVEDTIAQVRADLAEKDMLGRISTWPVDYEYMYTFAATEYAVKWINGEVPKEGIDVQVLKQLMEDYAGVTVYLTPYADEYPYTENGTGETYDNFLLMRMDYITY